MAGVFFSSPLSGQSYLGRPLRPAECEANDSRIEVLMLGSYHMSNPGADQFNLESDDVLMPERQGEIKALVDRLAEFEPTHVTVEAPWGDEPTQERWRGYLADERELRRSEEEQVGFRLAHQLGHESIHAIDSPLGLDFDAVGAAGMTDPRLGQLLGQMQGVGEEAISTMAAWLAEGSIGSMLAKMNTPEMIAKTHMPYVELFVPISVDENYAGPDMVADWYKRNLRIFSNLTRVAHDSDDKVFLIFGAGHIPIVRQLVIEHPGYCVEEPLQYLEGL